MQWFRVAYCKLLIQLRVNISTCTATLLIEVFNATASCLNSSGLILKRIQDKLVVSALFWLQVIKDLCFRTSLFGANATKLFLTKNLLSTVPRCRSLFLKIPSVCVKYSVEDLNLTLHNSRELFGFNFVKSN